jgi:probable HAF family extracellular repeat protein
MKSPWLLVALCGLIAAPASSAVLAAQAATALPQAYVAIDIGTLGGPDSFPNTPGRSVTESGIVLASATTAAIDPFASEPGCPPPCPVTHAAQWQKGVLTDLGALGGYQAGIFELNGSGVGAGFSETGVLDPLTGLPEVHAASSVDGQLVDIGTLGGNESWAVGINARGQISGFASNTVPDPDGFMNPFVPFPSGTHWHAALWSGGQIRDLGTLGGSDSIAGLINDRGQVAGISFTGTATNESTGIPTLHPFIWQAGRMRDLGTLGGTLGSVDWMNDLGEVVGSSSLAGDNAGHPFLWTGSRLLDLGTFGGPNGEAFWISQTGLVVGRADLPRVSGLHVHHAFVWQNSRMVDLPPVDGAPCSNGFGVNSVGQVVGSAADCHGNQLAAVLWQNGTAYDLNSLVSPTDVHLSEADYINERGEIYCLGVLPNGHVHVVLLVPNGSASPGAVLSNHVPARPFGERVTVHQSLESPAVARLFEGG